ncbi:hypothetical protein ACP6ET_22845 [Klebsiella quasipneumoniae]
MAFIPPLGNTSPEVLLDNATRMDKLINGPADTVPDRAGDPLYSWRQIMAMAADVLTAYQENGGVLAFADEQQLLAFTPDKPNVLALDGTTGAYWFWDGMKWTKNKYQFADIANVLSLAIQRLYISQQIQMSAINDTAQNVDDNNQQATDWLYGLEQWLQRLYLGQQNQITAISDTADKSDANEIALQRLYLAQQLHAATLSEVDSQVAYLSPENQLSRLMIIQQLIVALSALEGFDPADSATASPPLLDTHFVFGEPAGIIRISVNSPGGVPPNKNAGQYPTTARLDVDGKVISFYSTFEVQGDTSATFPKKNLNITFSSTADRDEDMDLKIGDIIPHDEWTFKSNWIDNTHARQYASFLLWSQMMDSRRGWPKRDIDNCYVGKVGPDGFPTGARAHPIGYPAVLYVNDAFTALALWPSVRKRKIIISLKTTH